MDRMDDLAGGTGKPAVTVVVPCYNESHRLDTEAFASFDGDRVEFLFVDDGSNDDTGVVIGRLVEADRHRFRLLSLDPNRGKAEAVRRGFLEAFRHGSDYVGYFDADLSTSLNELPTFLGVLDERPEVVGVLGSRVRLLGRSVNRRLSRHYLGRIFATLASLVLKLPVYDTQCGAKVFRATEETKLLFAEPFLSKWIFDVELLARFAQARRRAGETPESALVEVPLQEWRDVPGSKLRWRHGLAAIFQLWRIRRRYR